MSEDVASLSSVSWLVLWSGRIYRTCGILKMQLSASGRVLGALLPILVLVHVQLGRQQSMPSRDRNNPWV